MTTRGKANSKIADSILARPTYKVDAEVAKKLISICDFSDELAEEFDAETEPEVVVDVEGVHALVYVDLTLLTLEEEMLKKFLELTKVMAGMHFSSIDGVLRVQFGVKDLWVIDE